MKENELEAAALKHVKDKYPHYLFPLVLADLFLAGAHHAYPIAVERTVEEILNLVDGIQLIGTKDNYIDGWNEAVSHIINQIKLIKK